MPFDWARNNCCFFACDWISRLCGIDPAADFRDQVDSALSAARILAERGGVEGIVEETCARWNWPECAPTHARRGDVCLCETQDGPALGVCLGATVALVGSGGLVSMPLTQSRRSWRIL